MTQNRIVITSQRSKVRSYEDRSHKNVICDTTQNSNHKSKVKSQKSRRQVIRTFYVTQNKIVITSQRSNVRSHEDRGHKKVKRYTNRNCNHMSRTVSNKPQMRSHCFSERKARETLSTFCVSLPGASLFHGHWRLLSGYQPHLLTVNEIELIKQIRMLTEGRKLWSLCSQTNIPA